MENTCCFTGHRIIPLNEEPRIRERTGDEIARLIDRGVDTFITGGARGYDTLCAQTVLCFKNTYPHIKLHLALPCENQTKGWPRESVRLYEEILSRADETTYVGRAYDGGCMYRRNRFLVDSSSYVIAYCVKKTGGSYYTVKYAEAENKTIIYIT